MKNDFNYRWSKLFASKRYNTKDGVIKLTPEEQQELLDDSEKAVKNCNIADVSHRRELLLAYHRYLTEELSLDLHEVWVNEYLKANNCG